MVDIENWFQLKAEEDGLKTIPTTVGTAYWSVHHKASVGNAEAFKQYVIEHQAWDLMKTAAVPTAVTSYVEAHGAPPPGINYSSIKCFNLRTTTPKE